MSSATYGQLMGRAARQATVAWQRLEGPYLMETDDAREAIRGFRLLTRALGHQARYLLPERKPWAVRNSPKADPHLYLSARFAALTTTTSGPQPSTFVATVQGGMAAHLTASASAVDLLTTHKASDRKWPTPESSVLVGPPARLLALNVIAEMTVMGPERRGPGGVRGPRR